MLGLDAVTCHLADWACKKPERPPQCGTAPDPDSEWDPPEPSASPAAGMEVCVGCLRGFDKWAAVEAKGSAVD